MRKLLVCTLVLACVLCLAGCMANTAGFEIPEASKIELLSGTDGRAVEITNEEDIRHIEDTFQNMLFEKVRYGNDTTGWLYSLCWYDGEGGLLKEIAIVSDSRVKYQEQFYMCVGAGIDTAFYDRLLEGAGGE